MFSGLCFVTVIFIAVAAKPTCGDFVPKIASASPGEFPVFSCFSQHSSVDFTFKAVRSDATVILYNQAYGGIVLKYALDYRVDEADGFYNLTVLNASLAKAGTYKCEWETGSSNVELVVLAASPTCVTTVSVADECNANFRFECSVIYYGNIPPEIKFWKVSDQNKAGPINATEQFVESNISKNFLIQEVSSLTSSGHFVCQHGNSNRSVLCASDEIPPCAGRAAETKGIPTIAIALPVVFGILLVLLLLSIVVFVWIRRKKQKRVSRTPTISENGGVIVNDTASEPMMVEDQQDRNSDDAAAPISPIIDIPTLELIELISDGGYYNCYKARHLEHGVVSFKKHCVDCMSEESRTILKKEADGVKHFDHRNIAKFICTIFETVEACAPGIYGTVFEYLELDLSDFLSMFSLDWKNKLSLITDVALGMQYLHSQTPQIIHGSLRMESVFVNSDFEAKVSDFGFTQWKSLGQSSTRRRVGDDPLVTYPPEFVNANDIIKTTKLDMYSFGVLIWEIITQQKPFKGIAIQGFLSKWIVDGERPDTTLIPGDVAEECITLMKKCWASNPSDRPTFNDIVPVLKSALTDYHPFTGEESGIDENKLKKEFQLPDGGYFRSFKAILSDFGKVVYKDLPTKNITHEEVNEMKTEVGALRNLNHPNLVNPLPVVIYTEQTLGFIVPYHEYGNLHQYLRKTTVNRMTKISLLHDVACGMRYIHDHCIVHGDLKIENVLVSVNRNEPIAKICDCGLQQWKTCSRKHFTKNSDRFRTVAITPPENLTDPDLSKSTAYDVYSFSILIFQTLTPQKPYGDTSAAVLTNWVTKGIRPTVDENLASTGAYRGVVALMKTCWSQNPKERPNFQTITEDLRREMKSSYLFTEYNLQIIQNDHLKHQVRKYPKWDGYFSIKQTFHNQFGKNLTFKMPSVRIMKYRDIINLAKDAAKYQKFIHRNILKLVGIVVIPGSIEGISIQPETYGLAFEYDGGNTLLEYLRSKKPTWGEKLPLVHDVASAMSYLHNLEPPVTHGDLRMENVVVNADDKSIIAKVCNFGFTISIERNFTGTFEHFPPETKEDPNHEKLEAFDVYVFGILMGQMMTPKQKIPHPAATETCTKEGASELVHQEDFRPSPDVSQKCIDLLEKCRSSSKLDRPKFTEIVDILGQEIESHSQTNNNTVCMSDRNT